MKSFILKILWIKYLFKKSLFKILCQTDPISTYRKIAKEKRTKLKKIILLPYYIH